MYDNHSRSHGLFVHNYYIPFDVVNTPPLKRLDFCFDPRGIKILQSCNGLLLCCSHGGDMRTRKYYVLNPTTKQFSSIPSILGDHTIHFMCLAFHQKDCVHYKVICICRIEPNQGLCQIQIYSSDTRKWRISVESFYGYLCTFDKGVYWNRAIHWMPSHISHLYFELEAEQLRTLSLPVEMMSPEASTMYFGESRGHLHLIMTKHRESFILRLNVYEMLGDRSGWFVKYQVELDKLPTVFPVIISQIRYDFYVIDLVRGEKEDTFMVLVIPGKIITYNLHYKSYKHISYVGPSDFYLRTPNVHHYTETLASI